MNTERDEDFMENGCHNCSHLHYVKGEESMFCDVRERMLPVDSWTSAANHCGGWKESEEEEIDERNCVNCVHSHAVNGEEGVLCDVCGKMLGDAGNWDIFAKDCADYVNENQQHQIRIDEEFKALIPPLSDEERGLLEASIVADGCRDSLVLWDGVLIDGHHRHEICTRLGIEFDTVEMANLETRNDARLWIIRNQLGRRNLTNYQRAELVLKLKPAIAEKAKEQQQEAGGAVPQKSAKAPIDTRDELAKASGLSHDTIHKADFIGQHADEDTKQALRTGETSINREYTRLKAPEGTHVLISQSNSNEWYTPSKYVDAARRVMGGIDCDPASNETAQAWIHAEEYYTIETDGIAHEWHGCVWLNPPWGKLTGGFIGKLDEEIKAGRVSDAVVLVNAHATDTKWFTPLWNGLLCFTDHRIDYHSEETNDTGSTHGSVFVYFGANRDRFIAEFSKWGAIVETVS